MERGGHIAGDYTLVVSAFEPRHSGKFALRLECSERFELTPITQEGAGGCPAQPLHQFAIGDQTWPTLHQELQVVMIFQGLIIGLAQLENGMNRRVVGDQAEHASKGRA